MAITDVFEYRSPPINIEDIGFVHFRLHRLRETEEQIDLIRADVRIEGSTIFIYLSLATEGWPFVIENDSDHVVEFSQQVGLWPLYPGLLLSAIGRRATSASGQIQYRLFIKASYSNPLRLGLSGGSRQENPSYDSRGKESG